MFATKDLWVMIPLLLFYSTIILLYLAFMIWLLRGLPRTLLERPPMLKATKALCLIIPFKNEVTRLADLIADLRKQDYPAQKFRVVLVNDHSSDGSAELVRELTGSLENFFLLELPEGAHGKKQAIKAGVEQSKEKWILQTDADCRLGPNFLSSHMAFAGKSDAELMSGWVVPGEGASDFLGVFEKLESLSLTAAGAASFRWGRALMCSGANLLYSRELYAATREFDPAGRVASGDDMFLMIGARRLKRRLAFNLHRVALVSTEPAQSWKELASQRIRWGSKSTAYKKADIQITALLVLLCNLLVLCSPMGIIFFREAWLLFTSGIVLKGLADFLFLRRSAHLLGQQRLMRTFIPIMLAYYPFMLVTGLGSLFSRGSWKKEIR